MKIKLIGTPKTILSNPESKHNYFAWPSVVRLQNGRIAAGASGYRLSHICPFGKAVLSYSEDEGETYTAPAPIIDTPLDDRDVGLCCFGKSGLILTSFNNTVAFQRQYTTALDDGTGDYRARYLDMVTPEEEEKYLGYTFRISRDCGVTFGEIYKSPVSSPHGPTELNDGTILWVGRTIEHENFDPKNDYIEAHRINIDTGKTEFVGRIEHIYIDGKQMLSCEPHAIELPDGTILCHIRVQEYKREKVFTIYQSKSTDGGKTWTAPVPLLDRCGGAPPHILQHSSGTLISVYGRREMPYGIRAMFSRDGGETWDTENILYENTVSDDLGYPATVELSDHSLLTVFYAHPEEGTPAVIMQQKWAFEE